MTAPGRPGGREPNPPLDRRRLLLIVGILVGGLVLVGLAVTAMGGDDAPDEPEEYLLEIGRLGPLEVGMSTADAEADGELVRKFFTLCRDVNPDLTTSQLRGDADGRVMALDGKIAAISISQGAAIEPGGIQPGAPLGDLGPALGPDFEITRADVGTGIGAYVSAKVFRAGTDEQVFEVVADPESELIRSIWTPKLVACD